MKATFKVTNDELFIGEVIDVCTSGLRSVNDDTFEGTLQIETEDKGTITITGEFGYNDYEEEYGFILIEKNK